MFRRTVAGICNTICEQQGRREDVAEFVLGSVAAMPSLVRAGVWCATVAFGAAGRLYGSRAQQWGSWRAHRVDAARDLARFYESLVMVALYARVPERAMK